MTDRQFRWYLVKTAFGEPVLSLIIVFLVVCGLLGIIGRLLGA